MDEGITQNDRRTCTQVQYKLLEVTTGLAIQFQLDSNYFTGRICFLNINYLPISFIFNVCDFTIFIIVIFFKPPLRNRSALAVNCCVIIHCLEVSCKEDQITSDLSSYN